MKDKIKHVLLVDDDPDYVFLVQEALSDCQPSCKLTALLNETELFAWLKTNSRPSVIFLDINMTGANGFEILLQLKTTDRYKSIPVVMLSVSERRQDIAKSYQIGANAYMIKPMRFDDLKNRMVLMSNYWFSTVKTPGSSWLRPDDYATYN